EDRLAGALRDLANRQRNEAQANLRQAGPRLPFLEDALARVRALLERQVDLEKALAAAPDGGQPDPRREQSFALGDLGERARELIDARRRQHDWQRARAAAAELEKAAAAGDAQARERAQQRLQDVLERLARSPRGDDGAATRAAADALAKATSPDVGAQALQEAVQQAAALAEAKAEEHRAAADEQSEALREALARTAEQLAAGQENRPPAAQAL